MQFQKILTWVLVFAALSSATFVALQPQGETHTALAYAAGKKHSAIVMPYTPSSDELRQNIIKRLLHRLNKKNVICTINSAQAAHLTSKYDTETETLSVNGDELTVFKVSRATPGSAGAIRKYLRETGEERCFVVPARQWYHVVLGGAVS